MTTTIMSRLGTQPKLLASWLASVVTNLTLIGLVSEWVLFLASLSQDTAAQWDVGGDSVAIGNWQLRDLPSMDMISG